MYAKIRMHCSSFLTLSSPSPSPLLPSASENLASPVHGEILNFTRPVFGLPGATFTNAACIICVCLKRQNRDLTEKGNLVEKIADRPSNVFFRKPGENIDDTGCVTEGCFVILIPNMFVLVLILFL